MTRTTHVACAFAAAFALISVAPERTSAVVQARPNILLIVTDDMGYGDIGLHDGHDIPTPNIDALMKSGTRFTDAYVSGPFCSPTRAGLMTGRYPQRFGHEFNVGGGPQHTLSVAELLEGLQERYDRQITWTSAPWRTGDQRAYVSDIRRARQLLDWEPTIDVWTGIARLVEWLQRDEGVLQI